MRIGKSSRAAVLAPADDEPVTASNYPDRAISFVRLRGGGASFVIRALDGPEGSWAKREPATEPQWIAWLSYFERKEIPCAFLKRRGMGTVPCEWPEDFDLDCPISDRRAALNGFRPPIIRERVVELFRKLGM